MMSDDMELVREFAASQSETAFAALVTRHLSLVHSAAMRQVGDEHLAQEIAQAVFIILAKKAPALPPKTVLSAWLYRTTRYAAADALKIQRRRQAREHEAHMQSILNQSDTDAWKQLAPLLDDAMAKLGEADRTALVLRFFENKTLGDVAIAMNTNEAAAQRRVLRAVEKLRSWFTKRGVALPAAAMTAAIAANSVQAAPAGLAATICTVKGAAVAASVTALASGTIKTIFMTTIQKALIVVTVTSIIGVALHEADEAATLRRRVQALERQLAPSADYQQSKQKLDAMLKQMATAVPYNLNTNNTELLRLRGEVGALRRQLAEADQKATPLPTEDEFKLKQIHVTDAMTTIIMAIKKLADEHSGQYPTNFDQLTVNELTTTHLSGNLGLKDFVFLKPNTLRSRIPNDGAKLTLRNRVGIKNLQGELLWVYGRVEKNGSSQITITTIKLFSDSESEPETP